MQAKNNIGSAQQPHAPIALVAEDEVLLRLALADYLRDAGFHVLEAANGIEAQLIMAAADRVDVVISDVHMSQPGEGFELALWFAANHPGIPVILTSGSRGAQQSPQLAACINVTDFVPKPYAREEMERLARARMRAGSDGQ
jgi:DNA-binding NtrC family response regulator